MISLQYKIAVKVTKRVKYTIPSINAIRSGFYMESIMLFSKSVQLSHYAALLLRQICQKIKGECDKIKIDFLAILTYVGPQ